MFTYKHANTYILTLNLKSWGDSAVLWRLHLLWPHWLPYSCLPSGRFSFQRRRCLNYHDKFQKRCVTTLLLPTDLFIGNFPLNFVLPFLPYFLFQPKFEISIVQSPGFPCFCSSAAYQHCLPVAATIQLTSSWATGSSQGRIILHVTVAKILGYWVITRWSHHHDHCIIKPCPV